MRTKLTLKVGINGRIGKLNLHSHEPMGVNSKNRTTKGHACPQAKPVVPAHSHARVTGQGGLCQNQSGIPRNTKEAKPSSQAEISALILQAKIRRVTGIETNPWRLSKANR